MAKDRQPPARWRLPAALAACAVLGLVCAACSSTPTPTPPSTIPPSRPTGPSAVAPAYRLGSGDKLRVTVYNEKSLSGDYEISDQGVLAMPLIGPVNVGNMTSRDAEALLTTKFEKYLVNPKVGIEVLNYRPFFILGEVNKPGSYPYVSGMSVLSAVVLAGGFTPRAAEHDITIKHASDPEAKAQPAGENDPVLPGDILRVNQRFF